MERKSNVSFFTYLALGRQTGNYLWLYPLQRQEAWNHIKTFRKRGYSLRLALHRTYVEFYTNRNRNMI